MTTLKQKLLPATMQGGGFGGLSYLLRDEFSDVKAAGAVNGTPAVPGPGTRTVADTESKISISGGKWVVSGGKTVPVSTGDPGGHWGSYARKVGLVLKAIYSVDTTGAIVVHAMGWHANGTSGNTGRQAHFVYFSGGLVDVIQSTFADVNVGTYTAGGEERTAIIARGVGYWWFRKVSGQWLMVLVNSLGSSDPLFAYSYTFDKAYKIDSLRVPQQTYIPAPLAYAAFGGANGPLGNTDVLGPDLQLSPVLAWVEQVGTWAIVTNKATASALSGGLAIATVPTASADAHIRIALTRAGGSVGGVARYQDSSNYLRFSHDGTNALCEQVVAGVPTTLRTGAAAFVASAYIYLIVSGTTGWLFYNDAAIGASFIVPASTHKNHGPYTTNTGNTMDGFEAWPYGTGGEYGFLGGM